MTYKLYTQTILIENKPIHERMYTQKHTVV